jgi:hypothetical protein
VKGRCPGPLDEGDEAARRLLAAGPPPRDQAREPRCRRSAPYQSEAEIEPDRVLDDLGREAMAAVAERSHATCYPIRRWLPTRFP